MCKNNKTILAPLNGLTLRVFTEVKIGNTPNIKTLIDSGGSRTILGEIGAAIAEQYGATLYPTKNHAVITVDGLVRQVTTIVYLLIQIDQISRFIKVSIVPGMEEQVFLGINFIHTFGVVRHGSKRIWYLSQYPENKHSYTNGGPLSQTSET